MCLYSTKARPSKSKKEKHVYKVLIQLPCDRLKTPYMNVIIPQDGVMSDKGKRVRVKKIDEDKFKIDGGMIHSFSSLIQATSEVRLWRNSRLFKAVIPANTPYYIGSFGEMCSKKLIINLKEKM